MGLCGAAGWQCDEFYGAILFIRGDMIRCQWRDRILIPPIKTQVHHQTSKLVMQASESSDQKILRSPGEDLL